MSSIDSMCRQNSIALKLMKQLPLLVTNILLPEEKEPFELEVSRYHADSLLPVMEANQLMSGGQK